MSRTLGSNLLQSCSLCAVGHIPVLDLDRSYNMTRDVVDCGKMQPTNNELTWVTH